MVTGSEPVRLLCVGLHERCSVCTQGEHEKELFWRILTDDSVFYLYVFGSHVVQEVYGNRWRFLWIVCRCSGMCNVTADWSSNLDK
jgi:hypothetical protein